MVAALPVVVEEILRRRQQRLNRREQLTMGDFPAKLPLEQPNRVEPETIVRFGICLGNDNQARVTPAYLNALS